jgi:hypothetical protein
VSRPADRWVHELRSVVGPVAGVVVDVGPGSPEVLARVLPADQVVAGLAHRPDRRPGAPGPVARSTAVGDASCLPFPDHCADLVLCVDLLETSTSHRQVVRELARITAGSCVVSVPWEPWARLGNLVRGRDLGHLGRDPAHVQPFTPKRLVRTLRRGFRDVDLHPCFPWLVAECRGPRP